VSLVFIYGIVMNIKTAIPSLIDEGLPSQFVDEVKKISLTVNGVRDAHMVRSRKTPRGYFIDMHLLLDPNMPLGEAHEVVDKVERKIKESITSIVIADLVIHMEPYLSNGHE
jgi:divalent metal cation (Fe/Co/Zn/Cd) transporter